MTVALTAIANATNGAEASLAMSEPYVAHITIEGTSALLFHRWNCEAVEAKAAAAKGSRAKRTDDLESYVYRDEKGRLALPGEYIRQSIIGAARFRQDPRSPRKSALDLFKAGIAVLDEYASLGVKDWDYIDRRRVTVQRNGITRERPALRSGWKCTVTLQVLLPEYITSGTLNDVVQAAGRLIGVGDFRPTYGRFAIVKLEVR